MEQYSMVRIIATLLIFVLFFLLGFVLTNAVAKKGFVYGWQIEEELSD